jgi:hypothetical protein
MGILFLVVNASFNGWHGGAALGPRYLVPAVPFLALPLVLAFDRMRALVVGLTIVSAAIVTLGTAVDPQCPLGVLPVAPVEGRPLWRANPWTEYEVPLFQGRTVFGFEGPVSANPIGAYEGWFHVAFPPGSAQALGNSFNVGEGLFPRSRMSLVPLLCVWGAAVLASLGAAREAVRGRDA